MDYFVVGERSSKIRALASDALTGNWIIGFWAMLIAHVIWLSVMEVLMTAFLGVGVLVGIAYVMIIIGPITLGISAFSLSMARGECPSVSLIFYGFQNFGKAIGLFFWMSFKIFLWSLVSVPVVMLMVWRVIGDGFIPVGMLMPLLIASCIPAIIASIRYSQAFYFLVDNPDMGVFECVERSKAIMEGNKWKYVCLSLSFIGWLFLAGILAVILATILVLPFNVHGNLIAVAILSFVPHVGTFFVEAYMFTSYAVLYDMMVGNLRPGTIQTTAELVDPNDQQVVNMQTGNMQVINNDEPINTGGQADRWPAEQKMEHETQKEAEQNTQSGAEQETGQETEKEAEHEAKPYRWKPYRAGDR